MSDYLVNTASKPVLRKLMGAIGMPTPTALTRAEECYQARFLAGRRVLLGGFPGAEGQRTVEHIVQATGADCITGEIGAQAADARYHAMVFNAMELGGVADLKTLYEFFHPVARQLEHNGRVVVLASRPESMATVEAASAARAVEGFTRSFAKEIGKFGSTVNLLYVEPGAEQRLITPLRFFLSDHSTFVDGQAPVLTAAGCVPENAPDVQPLQDKVALVTGGAQGIGKATAKRLAAEGAHVVCLDVPQAATTLNETVAEFGGTALTLDLTDANAPRRIADFFKEKFDGVDIVIHNAGITRDKTLANMPEDGWKAVLGINLQAVLALDAVLSDENIINDHGRVVCLCSIGGIAGNRGQTNYGASKAGLIGFVERRANHQRDRGITVNAVAPGFIETRMTAAMPFGLREAGRRLSSLGQGGAPRDVAEAITFLCTPGAGGLSGNVLRVCGQSLIGA